MPTLKEMTGMFDSGKSDGSESYKELVREQIEEKYTVNFYTFAVFYMDIDLDDGGHLEITDFKECSAFIFQRMVSMLEKTREPIWFFGVPLVSGEILKAMHFYRISEEEYEIINKFGLITDQGIVETIMEQLEV